MSVELHYVKKDKILESIVDGIEVTAICGAQFVVVPTSSGSRGGDSEICERCVDIYIRMRPAAHTESPDRERTVAAQ